MLGGPVQFSNLSLSRADNRYSPVCQGRLTLTSGTAVTTSDVTGATSVYLTPYNGNRLRLYNGSRWRWYSFSELTLALGTLTSGKNYDVFVYDNAGTLTLEAVAWTDDTTRATALTTQDGIYVKNGATGRLYLGTFRTTSTTTTEDSDTKRFLWNQYNRAKRRLLVVDTTDTWTYGTATWRQVRADANNQVAAVCGQPELVNLMCFIRTNSVASASTGVGVGVTNANSCQVFISATTNAYTVGMYRAFQPAGYQFYAWLEISNSGTTTFAGDNGGTALQSGMIGEMAA